MTTPSASYDAVVIGTALPQLVAGALLAKRGFRVLLIGQDARPATYSPLEGLELPREPFRLLRANSPIVTRIFTELALTALLRRRSREAEPPLQVVVPKHRLDLARDPDRLAAEIAREFPSVKRPLNDFLTATAQLDEELDALLGRDLPWPPESFLERREHNRATAKGSFDKNGDAPDPLAELAADHPFRAVLEMPARFADGMDPDFGTTLRRVRGFSAWRDVTAIDGGLETLRGMLLDSLRTHGAEIRDPERIDAVRIKRGAVTGVRIAASGEEIGATWLLFGAPLATLLRLVPDRGPFEEVFERIGEPVVRYYRYTLNLRLAAEGVPEGIARDVFFLRDRGRPLSGSNALHMQVGDVDAHGERLLTVEALLPRRFIEDTQEYTATLRESLLASVGELVPFIGQHLSLVDSPHDSRGVQDLRAGLGRPPEAPWERGPHTMRVVYGFPVSHTLGVCALPTRSPLKRLLMCNDQVVPGLGAEGALLAAWSAARVVERSDRKKEWMRRGRWGKLEI